MQKINLCVIFGGRSTEHEVSRVSAAGIIKNLNKDKYNLTTIGIAPDGAWLFFDGSEDEIATGKWQQHNLKQVVIPQQYNGGVIFKLDKNTFEEIKVDVVFAILHGKNGEDGSVQGLLDIAGIPYVGSGIAGSAVCMDKCIAKILFAKACIPQADWIEIRKGNKYSADEIETKLGYPCFIKPARAGSSIGISKATSRQELLNGINKAFAHDDKILIEEYINGRELETAVMGNQQISVAPTVGEILSNRDFYDYEAKYLDNTSTLSFPNLEKNITKQLNEYAVKAYQVCQCSGLARVDFFLRKNDNVVYVNEINTLPGFTPISMYPKIWEKSGLCYQALLDELIELALSNKKS